MNAWTTNIIYSAASWFAQHNALSSAFLLILQVSLLITFSRVLVVACRNHPTAVHRIWFFTATLALVLIPMHTLRIGWQVSVPIARAALYDLVELPSTASSNLSETVTPASNPMVNFEHLTAPVAKDGQTPPRHLAFVSAIDTLRSKVQPRAFTKSDGSFEFSGLPTGWIANAYGYHRERLLDGIVAIGTSDDVSLKTSTMEALTLPVLRSPASLVLEPGVKVGGVIVDELGMPVSGTMVSSYASGYKVRTDALGKFQYDESAL